MKLEIDVDFEKGEGGWEGDISVPAQNARDLDLAGIVIEAGVITFEFPDAPGDATLRKVCFVIGMTA